MASFLLPAPGLPAHSWNLRGPCALPPRGGGLCGQVVRWGNGTAREQAQLSTAAGSKAGRAFCGGTRLREHGKGSAQPRRSWQGPGADSLQQTGSGICRSPCPFRLPLRRNGCPKPFILNIFLACWRRPGRQSALPNGHSCPALNTSEYLLRTRRPSLR